MKNEIVRVLQAREPKLCALATTSRQGKPSCAVMGYAVQDDFTIVLCTHKGSEKCKNINENNSVSLVFGWEFTESNIQIKGEAKVLEGGKEYRDYEKFYYSINSYTKKFKSEETVFIIVKPTWIRRTYMSTFPAAVEEMYLEHGKNE